MLHAPCSMLHAPCSMLHEVVVVVRPKATSGCAVGLLTVHLQLLLLGTWTEPKRMGERGMGGGGGELGDDRPSTLNFPPHLIPSFLPNLLSAPPSLSSRSPPFFLPACASFSALSFSFHSTVAAALTSLASLEPTGATARRRKVLRSSV